MPATKGMAAATKSTKTTIAKKPIPENDRAARQSEIEAKELKMQQSNFGSSSTNAKKRLELGTSTDELADRNLVAANKVYGEMGRFNPEKKLLLAKWQKDKTLSWWLVYEEARTKSFETTVHGAEGYGTKYFGLV